VLDRRRIELIEPGRPASPVEHDIQSLSDDDAARLVAQVRTAARRTASASLDRLAAEVGAGRVAVAARLAARLSRGHHRGAAAAV